MMRTGLPLTDYLISKYGFTPVGRGSYFGHRQTKVHRYKNFYGKEQEEVQVLPPPTDENGEVLDTDKFSCILRVHVNHYLFFSEELRYFTIAYRYEEPKGTPGGGFEEWKKVMWPKPIYTERDCDKVMEAIS